VSAAYPQIPVGDLPLPGFTSDFRKKSLFSFAKIALLPNLASSPTYKSSVGMMVRN
jgi:hypothetical protein